MDLAGTKEKKQHSSLYIPYSYYDCVIPDFFPSVPLHWHTEFEISLVSKGTGIFRCGNRSVIAGAGDIIIILPNMLHSISPYNNEQFCYNTILFNQTMVYGSCDDRCYTECLSLFCASGSYIRLPVTAEHPCYDQMKNALETVMNCARKNSGQTDLLLKSELLRIFWLLLQNNDLCHLGHEDALPMDSIRPALEYIRSDYGNDITVEQLADTCHLSKSYFMNLFRKVTGLSAIEYVNQIRIQAACELLSTTNILSSDAAFTCGFRNLSNFNRQFRKFTGFSPSGYRKQTHHGFAP